MPSQNVQVVERAYDAYFRGDIEAILEQVSPDVVVEQPLEIPDRRTYRGLEGMVQAIADWTGEWDDYRLEVLDMVDADPHVIVTVRQRGRGKDSGVQVEGEFIFVHTIEHGKMVGWRMFTSEAQALEALGLQRLGG